MNRAQYIATGAKSKAMTPPESRALSAGETLSLRNSAISSRDIVVLFTFNTKTAK